MTKKVVFLFPGQGAQSVGMCKSLYEQFGSFREVIEEVEDTCYRKLWPLIAEGPERELKRTVNCQLALFAINLAVWRVLKIERHDLVPTFCAGLSLGEYCALVAAGVVRLHDAADLLKHRAEYMQKACEERVGKMIATLGLSFEKVSEVLNTCPDEDLKKEISIANYNAHDQIVVAGSERAIRWYEVAAKLAGARRLIELEVAGAFHSPLMESAKQRMVPILQTARFQFSDIKVISNVTAEPVIYSEDFREILADQIVKTVNWAPTLKFLQSKEIDLLVEVGPGKVLAGLSRRNSINIPIVSVESVEDIGLLP